ncbi:chalcone isomerase family protein [Oxalobacteraceae bacterium]|nr:chalcone isomerase family protein [Oxalobacteraceae bacterium]
MNRRNTVKSLLAAAVIASSFSFPAFAATTVGGVKFEDSVNVAGTELKLYGAGVRSRTFFKLYVVGLYLPEKIKLADVMTQQRARRASLVMLRDLTSEQFGSAFMNGLTEHSDKAESAKILPQSMKLGAIFAEINVLKKGDTVTMDWVPGEGTVYHLNGRKIGNVVPDAAFANAVLHIWLGDKPADGTLKPLMLGEN